AAVRAVCLYSLASAPRIVLGNLRLGFAGMYFFRASSNICTTSFCLTRLQSLYPVTWTRPWNLIPISFDTLFAAASRSSISALYSGSSQYGLWLLRTILSDRARFFLYLAYSILNAPRAQKHAMPLTRLVNAPFVQR